MASLARLRPALAAATAIGLSGCSNVWLPQSAEKKFGEITTQRVLAESKESRDPRWQAYVDALGQRLAAVSERPDYGYTFRILESKEVNAFAVPDGSIFVTTGLLNALGDDEIALAGVLGHEIGHVARRHGAEQLQGRLGLSLALFAVFGFEGSIGRQAAGLGGDLVNLGYGRDMEQEADLCGIRYLAALGVPPASADHFLRRLLPLENDPGGPLNAYLRGHPPTSERLAYVDAYIARTFH